MYAKVEKTHENNSRAVANIVSREKSNVKQGYSFVDNRPITVGTMAIKQFIDNGLQNKQTTGTISKVVQRIPQVKTGNWRVGSVRLPLLKHSQLFYDDKGRKNIGFFPEHGKLLSAPFQITKALTIGVNGQFVNKCNEAKFDKVTHTLTKRQLVRDSVRDVTRSWDMTYHLRNNNCYHFTDAIVNKYKEKRRNRRKQRK